jgi:hypothetical protein
MKETMKDIMTLAWKIVHEFGWSIGRALRTAWQFSRLREAMKSGVVSFRYFKVDGTLRTARGTLSTAIIPGRTDGSGSMRRRSDAVQVYYDLDKGGWRSFRKCYLFNVQ